MNGKDVPSTTGELDMVMSHDVLEHLHDPPRYLFAELMKRVRTGGYVYVTVPNHVNIRKRIAVLFGETNHPEFERYYWAPKPFRGHLREYTRGDCIGLANALGLELVEVKGWHQGLDGVPRGVLRLYLAFSALFPNTRDSWSMIAVLHCEAPRSYRSARHGWPTRTGGGRTTGRSTRRLLRRLRPPPSGHSSSRSTACT
jgi:SAM-dependent methyltransferase